MKESPAMQNGVQVKSILNKKKFRDSWFLDDYTLNAYSGCSFNCLYCYIRGSKYGEHMEKKTSAKLNAVELLEKSLALRARKNQFGIIVMSSATDPYLQFERELKLTRELLQVIANYKFPVHIITKSDLVLRDIDLLHQINSTAILPDDLQNKLSGGAIITFSFSSADDDTARIFEPGATIPSIRLNAMRSIAEQKLLTGVSMMPLIPFISDTAKHLDFMFERFKEAGAGYVMPSGITLSGNGQADSRTLVLRAIAKHFPELRTRYEKWFANSGELPGYYRKAFAAKMKELSLKYELPDRIIF